MISEYENIYYAISKNGYVMINDNDYDYSQDTIIIELIKKYKKVIFGDSFNRSIDFLPDGITHLQLGRLFNKPIMNLPRSLKHLIIASLVIAYCNFNQSLDYLPEGLENLTMKLNPVFNMPINNLPESLKHLEFNCREFKHPINNLPNGLESLEITSFDYANTHYLPINLKTLIIRLSEDKLKILKSNLVNLSLKCLEVL
jgi:hypothetical protein